MTADFHTLDQAAQVTRLDRLAQQALVHFDMPGASAELINYSNNAIYRIIAGDGRRFTLRIHRPGLKHESWIKAELTWLSAIHDQTDLCAPVPVGSLYAGTLEGADGTVHCDLFQWIEGQPIAAINTHLAHAFGQYVADLHNFSARYDLPADMTRPRLDWAGLFGENSPYNPGPAGEALFTVDQRAIMHRATQQIKQVMAALDDQTDTFGLIHADLTPKNLLWADDTLCAIDFDDCAYGYYVYDLAPMMLLGFKDETNETALRNNLWTSYANRRGLSADQRADFEALVAARFIASIRWIAGNTANPAIRNRAPQIIAERVTRLETYLSTGEL